LWCADFKGQFRLGNQQYCYPLTITDYCSRYLLACEGLESTKEQGAFPVFERTFKEFGLPAAMRTDNGVPFASAHALFGISKLAVWWLRLGIRIERIKPGCPQQNGRHERMHLTLKKETTKPPRYNILQQQERFDDFIEGYNQDRPHSGLGGLYPAEVYTPSARPFSTPSGLSTPVTNAPSKSPNVDAFASGAARSTSVPSLRASTWGYMRSPTMFGLSALWITT
jgi:transposase InsO family protein